jgi:hypothetical protein
MPTSRKSNSTCQNRPVEAQEDDIAHLITQVRTMNEESGNHEGFDADVWLSNWVQSPIPALGGLTPASQMQTLEGRQIARDLIARMQSGAYS